MALAGLSPETSTMSSRIVAIVYSLHVFACFAYSASSQMIFDTRYPIVISDQFKHSRHLSSISTHFGFSVALIKPFLNQSTTNGYPQSWLLIGAPKGTSNDPTYTAGMIETGVVWRCSLGSRNAETCEILQLDPVPDESKGQCSYRSCEDYPMFESKNQSWVGANMASVAASDATRIDASGRFVTCAHRWTRGRNTFLNGLCYLFSQNDINRLYTTDKDNFMKDKINLQTFKHRLIPFFEKHDPRQKTNQNQYFQLTKYNTQNKVPKGTNSEGVKWAVGQAGNSFHMFTVRDSNKMELVIGSPGVYIWAGAVVRYQDGKPTPEARGSIERQNAYGSNQFRQYSIAQRKNSDTQHWYEYFGYAVTSGYYNISINQLLYVAGAPRSNFLQGEVVLFDFPEDNDGAVQEKLVLRPMKPGDDDTDKQTGSYFGSVLCTVNFNGDSYDDLFVGAPLYSKHASKSSNFADDSRQSLEGDEGCVFLYTSEKQFTGDTAPLRLIGDVVPGARFGSAITGLGDINGDGLNDIAIGAPYQNERSGVVYIYLGRNDNPSQGALSWNQKISASDFNSMNLRGFGISISNGMDIDENQTPDIAIGSYESDQVVVLRTRPSIAVDAKVIYELYQGDLRKSFSILPKTQQVFTIKFCVRVTAKFGRPSQSVSLKTILVLDERYQRFSLNKVSRFPPSVKLSNTSFEYSETLAVTAEADYSCTDFEATRLNDYSELMADNIPPVKIDLKVIQENQFNDAISTLIRHHRITNARPPTTSRVARVNTPVVEVLNNNQPGFKDFCPECTYQTQEQFEFSLPISNCIDRDCKPKLRIVGGFRTDVNNIAGGFIDKFIIGSSKQLILFLIIQNDGDAASLPKLSVKWAEAGLKTGPRPLECPDEPLRTSGSPESTLHCNIGHVLRNGRNRTLQIVFDMNDVFARELQEYLLVDVAVSTAKDNSQNADAAQQFALSLISDPKARVEVIASATKEIYSLSSPFDQLYEVYIDGKTPVASLSVKFKIPFYAAIKGQPEQITRVTRFSQPRQGASRARVHCDVPKEALSPQADDSGSGRRPSLPPVKGDMGGVSLDYDDENIMPKGELEISERRRRDTSPRLMKRTGVLTVPDTDTILLTCDDETNSLRTECLEIRCTAENVQPHPNILIFGFSMILMNNTAQALLDFRSKSSILFRSHAMAELVTLRDLDSDSGETIIHTVQRSVGVASWIYIVATVVGCGVLALIILILHGIGFFRREKKEQLNELKQEVLRQSVRSRVVSMPQAQEEQMEESDDLVETPKSLSSSSLSQSREDMVSEESKGIGHTRL